jgi:hypothetical protein
LRHESGFSAINITQKVPTVKRLGLFGSKRIKLNLFIEPRIPEFLIEFINAPGGVHEFHFTGKKGMRIVGNFQLH